MDTILHFRLTSERSAQEVIEGLVRAFTKSSKGEPIVFSAITGRETGSTGKKQVHTHTHLEINLSKATAKERLKKEFKCSKTTYQLTTVENVESNLSYVTKCGDIAYTDNMKQRLNDIKPWIWEKLDFKKRVKEIDDRYLDSGMDDNSYLEGLLTIYAEDGPKNLMLHQIRSHWLALFNRRNRLSVRRTTTLNGYEEEQYYPRSVLVSQIKDFIVNKY